MGYHHGPILIFIFTAAHLNPFYLREHSKRILRGALYNDSKFLADINVMDYSLVCGVRFMETRHQQVILKMPLFRLMVRTTSLSSESSVGIRAFILLMHRSLTYNTDYIRTYTWDKKLESWVKESAFLGGRGGEPTIVTPKQYRQRFISAMERYFPLVSNLSLVDVFGSLVLRFLTVG